ncbi:MAG: TIGR03862 family flavoprotein, partial [Sneathiella sp.]|nr:TIGR03862 family flavoprotein [Sneathiella sp.]
MSQSKPQVIIIGGGPAGLIASQRLSSSGKFDVHVYEQKGSVARKFLIAGRGGLNLTHSEKIKPFLKRYGPAEEFITPFIKNFSPANLQSWAADLGVETFVGSSGRIFPTEMKATSLMRAWTKRLTKTGVIFHLKHTFIGFDDDKNPQFKNSEGEIITAPADAVLFSMGGGSYAHLGATGDWVPLLEDKDIETEAFRPVNCGFDVNWSSHMLEKFEGQPLKNIRLSFNDESTRGDLVITKYGLEGGAIYALSRTLSEGLTLNAPINLKVDLRPDVSRDQIRELLSAPRKKQSLASILRKKVHLSPLKIALLWEFSSRENLQDIENLTSLIKGLDIPIDAMRP